MPLHNCHPLAPHTKLRLTETYVSSLMMERAVDAVMRRVGKLDRAHDIPYLAGYSVNGRIIYIDRDMPSNYTMRGRRVETDPFLILHEEVEKTMIDQLGLHYLHAHQIATRAEQAAVRACGIVWKEYDAFMQTNVTKIGAKPLRKVPADLDLKPYRDEHDNEILTRMAAAVERGHHPDGHHPEKLKQRIHEVHTEHKAHVAAKRAAGKAGTKKPSPAKPAASKSPAKRSSKPKAAAKTSAKKTSAANLATRKPAAVKKVAAAKAVSRKATAKKPVARMAAVKSMSAAKKKAVVKKLVAARSSGRKPTAKTTARGTRKPASARRR